MTVTDFSSISHLRRPAPGRSTAPIRSLRRGRRVLPSIGVHAPWARPRIVDAGLAAALLGSVALLGTAWIDTARGSWFDGLRKPRFGDGAPHVIWIGWTAVCVTTAVALWLAAQRRRRRREFAGAVVACLAQPALLLAWVWTFFVDQAIGRSLLLAIVAIVSSTLTVAAFSRLSRSAGALMVPTLAWAAAISVLSAGVLLVG